MNHDLDVLILPGWGDSGPEHWQTLWLNENPRFKRVVQRDWIHSDLDEWVETLNTYVSGCALPAILVGHSLSSILIAHWATRHDASKVVGALIVAPTDVERRETCPPESWGFEKLFAFRPGTESGSHIDVCDLAKVHKLAAPTAGQFFGSLEITVGIIIPHHDDAGKGQRTTRNRRESLCARASAKILGVQ